jgi:hypothetical protein
MGSFAPHELRVVNALNRRKIGFVAYLSGDCQVFDVSQSRSPLYFSLTQPRRTHDRS